MALPGGRREAQDPDLIATVIREAAEEVGVFLERGQLVAALDDVVPQNPALPPVAVRPYVFLLAARPALALNTEVSEAAWVPLEQLLHPRAYRSVRVKTPAGTRISLAYQLERAVVWGTTERILTGLLAEIRRKES